MQRISKNLKNINIKLKKMTGGNASYLRLFLYKLTSAWCYFKNLQNHQQKWIIYKIGQFWNKLFDIFCKIHVERPLFCFSCTFWSCWLQKTNFWKGVPGEIFLDAAQNSEKIDKKWFSYKHSCLIKSFSNICIKNLTCFE